VGPRSPHVDDVSSFRLAEGHSFRLPRRRPPLLPRAAFCCIRPIVTFGKSVFSVRRWRWACLFSRPVFVASSFYIAFCLYLSGTCEFVCFSGTAHTIGCFFRDRHSDGTPLDDQSDTFSLSCFPFCSGPNFPAPLVSRLTR